MSHKVHRIECRTPSMLQAAEWMLGLPIFEAQAHEIAYEHDIDAGLAREVEAACTACTLEGRALLVPVGTQGALYLQEYCRSYLEQREGDLKHMRRAESLDMQCGVECRSAADADFARLPHGEKCRIVAKELSGEAVGMRRLGEAFDDLMARQ